MLPSGSLPVNNERTLHVPETIATSCSGYCSGHSDEFVASQVYDRETRDPENKPPWDTYAEPRHTRGPVQNLSHDIWVGPGTSCGTKPADNVTYLNVDDTDDEVSGPKYISPEFPFVKEERHGDSGEASAVDVDETCAIKRTGKNNEPRDQETQTFHESVPTFGHSADLERTLIRDISDTGHHNQSPTVNLPVGNSFQMLPTFIPVPSDHNGTCFVSPTLGYQVSAASHPQFAQVPSTTHVLHPRAGQEHYVYLPSQIYSHHLPRTVSTVYTSHVPPDVPTTVRSPSAAPVILGPSHVAFKRPPAPTVLPNFTIPTPSFPTSSPNSAIRYTQSVTNVNAYRRYLMGTNGHVAPPMYQYTGFVSQ